MRRKHTTHNIDNLPATWARLEEIAEMLEVREEELAAYLEWATARNAVHTRYLAGEGEEPGEWLYRVRDIELLPRKEKENDR